MGEIIFIPVVSDFSCNRHLSGTTFYKGYHLNNFGKNAIFKKHQYLINPFLEFGFWPKIIKKELEEGNDILKNHLVFSDSGGLQELTVGKKNQYSPSYIKEIFEWQQKYSTVGFSFDIIPFDFETNTFLESKFEECALKSKENIDICSPLRDRINYPKFQFYGIIQGRHYSEYDKWLEILDHPELDGYCVKSTSYNSIASALTACFVMERINKPVHFLGQGFFSRSIIPIYLSNYFKHRITFDSSSYDSGIHFRQLLCPFSIKYKIQIGDSWKYDFNDWKPGTIVFSYFENEDLNRMIKEKDVRISQIISMSNLEVFENFIRYLILIKKNKDDLLTALSFFYRGNTLDNIKISLDIIDDCYKYGWRYVEEKYSGIIKSIMHSSLERKNKSLQEWKYNQ